MFQHRRIDRLPADADPDGLKLYGISSSGQAVDFARYSPQLQTMKDARPVRWAQTPAFAICHDGASARYLVLGWWGNDNEMFVAVAADDGSGWVEDMSRYSFCLWDMEVMWHERNAFVVEMYGATPSLEAYRANRFTHVL
ncbi:hypothetical protein [Dyella silvae]|uniref:hypothetical protein n=1 Tax=Dyella silvae TaxID=2994424 RepID=UPI002263F704|nr:hypothetical protein [Dyella silvae]